jgi:cysteine desulfurase
MSRGQRNRAKEVIYLDYQATTPTDPRVVEAMLPYFSERFGNPHSVEHAYGWDAEEAVERGRAEVAALIGAEPREIVFTSGATEANNLAIKGAAAFHRERRPHVVTLVSEHKCVLETVRGLERRGHPVTILPIEPGGLVDLERLAAAITEETCLVSIMAVNNEIGVIQPLAEIGALCRERGVYFHSDAAQAVGKIPIDVQAMAIDLLSISGHKLYGPKGIGALYVRRRPRVRLEPLFDGGGQERGFRSGTLPTPLCVGLGEACRIAGAEMTAESARLRDLRDDLLARLRQALPEVAVNGDAERRIAGNLNLRFPGIDADALVKALSGLAVSTGSACSSTAVEPSYVLRALGLSEAEAGASIRIGFGRFTSAAEVAAAAEQIIAAVRTLQDGSSAAAE